MMVTVSLIVTDPLPFRCERLKERPLSPPLTAGVPRVRTHHRKG